jgi:hypothetical protein
MLWRPCTSGRRVTGWLSRTRALQYLPVGAREGTMPGMNSTTRIVFLGGLLAFVTTASCGGETIASNDGGAMGGSSGGSTSSNSSGNGGSHTGSSSGVSTSSSSGAGSSGGSLPEPGTAACDMQSSGNSGICVLCADYLWHCDGAIFKPCPPNITDNVTACVYVMYPSTSPPPNICHQPCSDGGGINWTCEQRGTWSGNGCP